MNFKLHLKLAYFLLLIFLELVTNNRLIWAQTKPNRTDTTETRQNSSLSSLKLPARGSPIGRRRGGTSRNNCPALDSSVTALVPGQETRTGLSKSESFLASTVSEHPTFWLYIPKLPARMTTGEFILQTETGEDLTRTQIRLPEREGAIAVSLSENSPYSLAVGKKYHWYFRIYCGKPTPDSDYIFVDAWIQRVSLTSELKIQLQITKKADYLIYNDRHIWYDALTNLGKQLKTNPNSDRLKTDWVNLLESIDLSYLSDFSIVKIYQLQS